MPHHIIFEGAELAGKSWLMSQVYDYLEPKYNKNKYILDGCHWFNCDVAVYGTENGKPIIKHYLEIFKQLRDKNILVEKLHISDIIYNQLYQNKEVNYKKEEKILNSLGFKIILIAFIEDKKILLKRIQDRLNLYPHYERILRDPDWYIQQQRKYIQEIKKTSLPYLIIWTNQLPNHKLINDILKWIGEK
ncbi:MAG: hypothetical protein ABII99_00970 [Patescibacteria group bacterium]|nr:hypothetical protein [Patescibacteria group bacterium]MBU1421153.1 hypothetical protein [Patescibacteria group bacterium]MBU2415751.1 hypothetical protein [Patescibacteria group bacterium]MBU2456907.1 hypothetical protein [Patescibacteria group bacterium]